MLVRPVLGPSLSFVFSRNWADLSPLLWLLESAGHDSPMEESLCGWHQCQPGLLLRRLKGERRDFCRLPMRNPAETETTPQPDGMWGCRARDSYTIVSYDWRVA
jgi:hypothetical protein